MIVYSYKQLIKNRRFAFHILNMDTFKAFCAEKVSRNRKHLRTSRLSIHNQVGSH